MLEKDKQQEEKSQRQCTHKNVETHMFKNSGKNGNPKPEGQGYM